jgi:ubiquinone/menaquinone biosynthesis C-methylase UbiE
MRVRVLEPEVMDTAEEAADYDAMDHGAVNRAFVDDLLAEGPADLSATLDAGTGTALIALELCRRSPSARVLAIDLATHMLALGEANVRAAGMASRVRLERRDAKSTGLESARFSTVMSNSLVHHVPDPEALLRELARLLAPGALLFVRDLVRPSDEDELGALMDRYAGGRLPSNGSGSGAGPADRAFRQRALFDASLRAALSLDEVQATARAAGLADAHVDRSSDRHFTLVARAR